MTTATLIQVREMNAAGMNDREIGEKLGKHFSRIYHYRKLLGIPAVQKHRADKMKHVIVRLAETGEPLAQGTFPQCAEAMHLSVGHLRQTFSEYNRGIKTKYTFLEVKT